MGSSQLLVSQPGFFDFIYFISSDFICISFAALCLFISPNSVGFSFFQ